MTVVALLRNRASANILTRALKGCRFRPDSMRSHLLGNVGALQVMNRSDVNTTLALIAALLAATGPVVPPITKLVKSSHSKSREENPVKRATIDPLPTPAARRRPDILLTREPPRYGVAPFYIPLAVAVILSAIAFSRNQTIVHPPFSMTAGSVAARLHLETFAVGLAIALALHSLKRIWSLTKATVFLVCAYTFCLLPVVLGRWSAFYSFFPPYEARPIPGTLVLLAFVLWASTVLDARSKQNRPAIREIMVASYSGAFVLLLLHSISATIILMLAATIAVFLSVPAGRIIGVIAVGISAIILPLLVIAETPYAIQIISGFFKPVADTGAWEHTVVLRALAGAVPFGKGTSPDATLIPLPYSSDALAGMAVSIGTIAAAGALGCVVFVGILAIRRGPVGAQLLGAVVLLSAAINVLSIIGITPEMYVPLPAISYDSFMTFFIPTLLALTTHSDLPTIASVRARIGSLANGLRHLLRRRPRMDLRELAVYLGFVMSIDGAEADVYSESTPPYLRRRPSLSGNGSGYDAVRDSPPEMTIFYSHGECTVKHRSMGSAMRCRRTH
jgi:cell division protein FtsW (lipid II flippase)